MIKTDNSLTQIDEIASCLTKIANMADESDSAEIAPSKEFELLAEAGLLKIVLPGEELDFNESRTADLLLLLKKIGMTNLSVGRIYEGHVNALYLIHIFGTKDQRNFWYNQVRFKNALFGVWNTQSNNGVMFENEKGEMCVSGKKTFCSGAALVSHALITGNINTVERKGWQMMVLNMDKIDDERIDKSTWKTLGMKASGSYTVDFTGYKVAEDELLAQPGEYLKQPFFNGGAIRFAAVQLGGAEAIAMETIRYLKLLNRTDNDLQNIRISNIMTAITAGNIWIDQAGKNYDEWVDQPEKFMDLIAFANMTRTAIEEIGLLVMKESNQCVGARGLMHPFCFERLFRDLSFYLRQPAPDATKLDIASYFFKKHD